jgi:hypothetical protein
VDRQAVLLGPVLVQALHEEIAARRQAVLPREPGMEG